MSAPSRVFWERRLDVADKCVRRDRQEVPLAEGTQFQPKTSGTSHFVVARDQACGRSPGFRRHLQRQLMAGLELDRLWHSGFLATPTVFGPFFRKVRRSFTIACSFRVTPSCRRPGSSQACRNDRTIACRRPADLSPFLGKCRGSNTITPSGSPRSLPTSTASVHQRLMIPRHCPMNF